MRIAFKDILPEGLSERERALRRLEQGFSGRQIAESGEASAEVSHKEEKNRVRYPLAECPLDGTYRQKEGPYAIPEDLEGFTDVIPNSPIPSVYSSIAHPPSLKLASFIDVDVMLSPSDIASFDPDGARYMLKNGITGINRKSILDNPSTRQIFRATFNKIHALPCEGLFQMPGPAGNWYCPTCGSTFREEDLVEVPPSKCPACTKEAHVDADPTSVFEATVPAQYTSDFDPSVRGLPQDRRTLSGKLLSIDEVAEIRPGLAATMRKKGVAAIPLSRLGFRTAQEAPVTDPSVPPVEAPVEPLPEKQPHHNGPHYINVPDREKLLAALEKAADTFSNEEINDEDVYLIAAMSANAVAYMIRASSIIHDRLIMQSPDPEGGSDLSSIVNEIKYDENIADLASIIQDSGWQLTDDSPQLAPILDYYNLLIKLPDMIEKELTRGTITGGGEGTDFESLDDWLLKRLAAMQSSSFLASLSEKELPNLESGESEYVQ